MYRFFFRVGILLCVVAFTSLNLLADSFRCGRRVISSGDSSGDLIRVCGEPRHKDRGNEKIKVNGEFKDASVERWYYKTSSRGLEHIILVHKGRVMAVEVGDR